MKHSLLLLLFLLTGCNAQPPAEIGARLVTSLSCATNSATREATVWFTWQIENTGDKSAHLLNHCAYASRGPLLSLQFASPGQQLVTVELDIRDCVTWGTQEEKIRTLSPKGTFKLKARADLKAFGPLLPGQYTVFAFYEPKFWAREMMTDDIQKKYNLTPDDIWQDRLESNRIQLTIKE